jgi:hypothetical protein
MNKTKILEAFYILTDALAEEAEDEVTLKWTVTKRELKVLRCICRTDVSVPGVVQERYPGVGLHETRDVLRSLGAEINRLPS